jgi:hypothetical protein
MNCDNKSNLLTISYIKNIDLNQPNDILFIKTHSKNDRFILKFR